MKKRVLYSFFLMLMGANLFIGAQIYSRSAQAADKENAYQQVELFMKVLEQVRQNYVDGDKVSYHDLIQSAMRGMISTLDPHSEFLEPVKYTDLKNDTEGAFGGVGIVVGLRDGQLSVVSPMEDSPAFKAGIVTGDRISKINGASTERMTLPDAVKVLRGKAGTDVTITITRPSQPDFVKDVTLTRAVIKVSTVKDLNGLAEFPVDPSGVGYARITQFGEQTTSDFDKALKSMAGKGMKGLILDLRNNPGGLLDQAVKVCDIFLPRGQLIVSTEGRAVRSRSEEFRATGRDQYPGLKMVILVNGGSASASEIVSGCLQDIGRAYLIGEQTFGKGSVQSILPFEDGSALRLTTAKYYTPSHKVIHEKGITPDSIVPTTPEEEEALFLKRVPGGVEGLDAATQERVNQVRDEQLARAQDFLKGVLLLKERAAGATPDRRG
jgi:carboxyl-terminal processing protease